MVTEATRRDCASISRLCISLVPCECKPTVERPSSHKQLFLANYVNCSFNILGGGRLHVYFTPACRWPRRAWGSGRLEPPQPAEGLLELFEHGELCRDASCSRLHLGLRMLVGPRLHLGLRMRLGMRSFMRFREATHALYGPDSPPPQHSSRPAHAARLREAKHALYLGPVPNSLFSWSCASDL